MMNYLTKILNDRLFNKKDDEISIQMRFIQKNK